MMFEMQKHKQIIKRATVSDMDLVLNILSASADWLSSNGMDHWKGAHTAEKVLKRFQDREIYLLYYNDIPVGTIALSTMPPFYYNETDKEFWKDKSAPAMYISSLAVLPNYHGKGFATELVKFAERRAIEEGYKYIRFDAVGYYTKLTKFYLDRNYKIVGKRLTRDTESNFFEKSL
jgi:GNAT superfamily N-acetyltransferase